MVIVAASLQVLYAMDALWFEEAYFFSHDFLHSGYGWLDYSIAHIYNIKIVINNIILNIIDNMQKGTGKFVENGWISEGFS